MIYLYIKNFHIIAVVLWLTVMFYLVKLYIYHRENSDDLEFVKAVEIREYKLYSYIGLPSFIASIMSGVGLIHLNSLLLLEDWLILKLCVLVLLIFFSFSMEYYRIELEIIPQAQNSQFYKAYNTIPVLLSTLIIMYSILKDVMVIASFCIIIFFGIIIYKIAKLKT